MPGTQRLDLFTERVRSQIARSAGAPWTCWWTSTPTSQRSLRYDIRMEPGVFAPDETLERGHGSCRDFAWLLVQVLRRLGFAARFVSGYSIQLVADQKPLEGPAGVDRDVTDLHAWAEVFLPGAGWVGLDATSGLMCGEGHIPLAATPDPGSAAPITGSFGWIDPELEAEAKPEVKFDVTMSVARLDDPPRPTKPYDDRTWRDILACGDVVDAQLERQDVRLTMGGEPTFVSVDDMDGAGVEHRRPGPHQGASGRPAAAAAGTGGSPRGRCCTTGRASGTRASSCPAGPTPATSARTANRCGATPSCSPRWATARAPGDPPAGGGAGGQRSSRRWPGGWGWIPGSPMPGFEDVYYYLWRERRLPANVDPFDARLEDEDERARLRRVFEQGLARKVGFALPLRPADEAGIALADRPLVPAQRAPVPAARGFAHGLPAAAGFAALVDAGRPRGQHRPGTRPAGTAPAAAVAPEREPPSSRPGRAR